MNIDVWVRMRAWFSIEHILLLDPRTVTHVHGFRRLLRGALSGGKRPAAEAAVEAAATPLALHSMQRLLTELLCTPVEVTCNGGCSCQPTVLQGRWEQRTTQLDQQRISVSQVRKCLSPKLDRQTK